MVLVGQNRLKFFSIVDPIADGFDHALVNGLDLLREVVDALDVFDAHTRVKLVDEAHAEKGLSNTMPQIQKDPTLLVESSILLLYEAKGLTQAGVLHFSIGKSCVLQFLLLRNLLGDLEVEFVFEKHVENQLLVRDQSFVVVSDILVEFVFVLLL